MPDKTKSSPTSKTGTFKRPNLEPEAARDERNRPLTLPEYPRDPNATTGVIPVVTEGEDTSAERDNDKA
ncbi:MAG: hypothetical protein Kow00117_18630 [Phototrophicales bacterium]